VSGLTFRDSGGDGIYIGVKRGTVEPCKDILIRDCIFDNNYRQGISLISGENIRISNCALRNTHGSPPGAGIDLEPNSARDRLVDVVVSECVSENNNGPGFVVSLRHLSSESEDVSILFVDCYVKSGKMTGMAIGALDGEGPGGLIEFRNCTVQNTYSTGAYIANKPANNPLLRFSNCKWQNVATGSTFPKNSTAVPICFVLEEKYPKIFTGVEFENCYVYDNKNRPSLAVTDSKISFSFSDVGGNINVYNPYGGKVDWGGEMQPADLKIKMLEQ
jgi:parallel beta-helix repeat protein